MLDNFEAVRIAKQIFADHGFVAEGPTFETLEQHPDQSHVFPNGSECHAVVFENGYVHFHIGKEQWKDLLPDEAPEIRIRYMTHRGIEIARDEWFSC
jgi:hypothetical protein